MFQKLFQIVLVLALAIMSIVFIAFLLTGIASYFQSPVAAGSYGITIRVGGLSASRFSFLVLAAMLLAGGCYLLWRRRRINR